MKKTVLLFMCIMLSLAGQAQWTPDSTLNTLVADVNGVEETTPLMATRVQDGFTYVSWFKQNAAGTYDLYMQLLDTVGNEMWTPGGKLISSLPQSTALYRYDLKTDNVGNVVVAFQDLRQGSNLTIAVYKLDVAGNHLFNPNGSLLFDSLATSNIAPVIGFNRRNQTIIAWNASDNSNNKWISFQKFNAAGGPLYLGPKRIRDATGAKKFGRPNIVAAKDTAGIIMQYVQETGNFPGVTSTLYAQHFDDNGLAVWNGAVQLSTYTIPYFFFPSLLSDQAGGFWIAFNGPNPAVPSQTDVYLQHMDSLGILWSPAGTRVSNVPNEMRFYFDGCLTRTASGLMIAVQTTDLSQATAGIAVQAFDFAGTPQYGTAAITVLPLSSQIHQPFALANTGSNTILCYKSGGFGNQELRAARIGYNAVMGWNRSLSNVASNKDDMAAGKHVNHQLVTVWQDDRNGGGIYAQNISTWGTAGVLTSVEPVFSTSSVSISPNPGKNPVISLNGPLRGETQVEVLDLKGRILRSEKFSGPYWSAGFEPQPGMYLIRMTNDGQTVVLRWMAE